MQEVIHYPVHGNKRGGTGYSCLGGFAYGCGLGEGAALAPDRPTDLFAPSLTTQVEESAAAADGDRWLDRTPAGGTVHAPMVDRFFTQPATNALTTAKDVVRTGKLDLRKVPLWAWAVGAWMLLRR